MSSEYARWIAESGMRAVPVLYLDLDSTVREGYHELGRFVNCAEDVEVFPEALTAMRAWKDQHRDGRIAGVTNQGGIALGHMGMQDAAEALRRTDDLAGGLFDTIYTCPHHPDAIDPEMARCWCRKPSPGAIAEAARALANRYPGEYYPAHLALFVGDMDTDRQCAEAAGVDFVWAKDWRAAQ